MVESTGWVFFSPPVRIRPLGFLGGWEQGLEQSRQDWWHDSHTAREALRMKMLVGPLCTEGRVCIFRVLFSKDSGREGQDMSHGGRKSPA